MLICSALATTFATFFFGTWADRTGKRRKFIAIGYILWGIFTIGFGLTKFISKDMYMLAAVSVVVADTVMRFFGSMGNDAGFNTWTTDILTDKNRGQNGAALATQPVLGTILGTAVGGLIVGENNN
ncbi:MAG: MFS transporter [Clostridia bacterium]|nr:MFS transporter [Clostridia bacterium]